MIVACFGSYLIASTVQIILEKTKMYSILLFLLLGIVVT